MISNRREDHQMKIAAPERPSIRPDFLCLFSAGRDRKGGVLSEEIGKSSHIFAREGKDGNHAP
jgi:hypothetical protein